MSPYDPELWPKLMTSLGQLVVSSGSLEETVRSVVLNMMGGPHWRRTGLVIDGYSASQMNERARRLGFQVLGGPLQTDVIEWIQQVEKVQIRRNNIVHSHWSHIDFSGTPAATTRKVRKAKRELEQVSQKWTPAEIDQLTGEISLVDIEGTYLVVELQGFSLVEGRDGSDLAPWVRQGPRPVIPRSQQWRRPE
jgi:hypothetical protein